MPRMFPDWGRAGHESPTASARRCVQPGLCSGLSCSTFGDAVLTRALPAPPASPAQVAPARFCGSWGAPAGSVSPVRVPGTACLGRPCADVAAAMDAPPTLLQPFVSVSWRASILTTEPLEISSSAAQNHGWHQHLAQPRAGSLTQPSAHPWGLLFLLL